MFISNARISVLRNQYKNISPSKEGSSMVSLILPHSIIYTFYRYNNQ